MIFNITDNDVSVRFSVEGERARRALFDKLTGKTLYPVTDKSIQSLSSFFSGRLSRIFHSGTLSFNAFVPGYDCYIMDEYSPDVEEIFFVNA